MEEERMLTENEQLHVDYNNAVADAEFYKDKLDIATRKSVGYRVGSYINKMIRKTRKLLQNIRSWKFFRSYEIEQEWFKYRRSKGKENNSFAY